MAIELKVPQVGESVTEVQVGRWLKAEGDSVGRDEGLVEIETDKVTVELPAPSAGKVGRIVKKQGEPANVGEVIGYLEEDGKSTAPSQAPPAPREVAKREAPPPSPSSPPPAPPQPPPQAPAPPPSHEGVAPQAERQAPPAAEPRERPQPPQAPQREGEEIVPMSPLRRRVAQRLVEAQHHAALLTTFNEVDMSAVLAVREQYQQAFQDKYKIKLGFMSFFVKAAIDALKQFPGVNAEVRGTDIVYRNYYDIGVAVSTEKGLVVPVLRGAERMSFAQVEQAIADLAARARDVKLKLEELEGGTFTITNGGVFGSLLSTPIVNPPQSGILGLHAITKRAVVINDEIVARPMMYVALTYDHRVVDGREAVLFLRRIKEVIESPLRLMVEV